MQKEGYQYGLPLVLISGALIGFGVYPLGAFCLLAAIFVLNFFRDPDRPIPRTPAALVAPADGRVVQITEETIAGRTARRVSIFMSPLDVHVNRSPVAGTVKEVVYRKGAFHIASRHQASVENEQNSVTIEGEQGTVVVRQIAGVLARRIVFWKRPGDTLERGERMGMIKFGSRVDLVVDSQVDLRVKVGDHVRAGSSIVGLFISKDQC